jgi:hypothetical protein
MRELHDVQLPPDEKGWELSEVWIEEDGWKARAHNFTKPGEDRGDRWQVRIFDPKGILVWQSENGYTTMREWHFQADKMLTTFMKRNEQ